jgi:hypothetical protein
MVEPSLFPNEQPPAPAPDKAPPAWASRLGDTVNETASRLAVLEERAANLRKKTQMTEQSLIDYEQEARADLQALTERLTELARKVDEVQEKINAMAGELANVVKKNELTVLERYLDLWQPLDFVTRDEAKLLIEEARRQKKA